MTKIKSQSKSLVIDGHSLKLNDVWNVAFNNYNVSLDPNALSKVVESRTYLENRMNNGEVMYGVNTGFGHFSDVRISNDQLVELQKNLIRSHCCGIGQPFSKGQSRAVMLLRANALARGHSGIRPQVIEKILEFLNNDIIPVIPEQGSVGASGDLAPLSHLALALMGEGEVWDASGKEILESEAVLKSKKIEPLILQAKEGLSLINGCQVMTAVGLLELKKIENLLLTADIAGSLTLEALRGSRKAFDPLIPQTRPHPGEATTASNMRILLGSTSQIAQSHEMCNRVQDAYSLRCIPAVHGAAKDTFRRAVEVLETEANSSTDNPLVFASENKILSCGNFHGEPVAFQLDFLAIAISAMTSMSECRVEKLINPAMSGLPAFLAPDGGLNSGMMIVQVACASLVSENKILSHPASVDSIPTSADKEDHVSMGTIAARKLKKVVENSTNVLAMELLCALQGLDLIGEGVKPEGNLKLVYDFVRQNVSYAAKDRVFAKDISLIKSMVEDFSIRNSVATQLTI